MAIPLVGSPAPAVGLAVLANKVKPPSDFTGSVALGGWTNSGGTLTADATAAYLADYNNAVYSAKLVTTADGQSLYLPIAGTFKMGVEYVATFAVCYEETTAVRPMFLIRPEFGQSGDWATLVVDISGTSEGNYRWYTLRWTPTATRNGVRLTIWRNAGNVAGNVTLHIGYVAVRRAAYPGEYPIARVAADDPLETQLAIIPGSQWVTFGPQPRGGQFGADAGIVFARDGAIGMATGLTHSEMTLYDAVTSAGAGGMYAYAEHTVPDAGSQMLPNGAIPGWDFEVGDDYVGHMFFEKDTDTLGWIPDQNGQDIDLWSRKWYDSTKGDWRALSRNSSHAVILHAAVANPMTAQDDLILGGVEAYVSTSPWSFTPDGTGSVPAFFFGGTIESVCGFRQAWVGVEGPPSGTQAVTWNIWISLDNFTTPGSSKTLTIHLRRTNATGAILATDTYTTSADSRVGHSHQWTGTFNDASPTDGIYVITAVAGNTDTLAYVDTFALGVSGNRLGNATRLAKGSDYQVLATDVSDHHVKWLNLPLRKLAGQTIGNTSTTIAHGLAVTPSIVIITPRSNATFWEAAVADGTNVYIQASAAAQTADIYVAP